MAQEAGNDAFLLPEGSGRPFRFGPWVQVAAKGQSAEAELNERIRQIWKTDLFLSADGDTRHFAATVKSNVLQLEGGRGLRVGIVPESTQYENHSGIKYDRSKGLWVVSLADPNGFMGLFNDAYHAMARSMCTLGKQPTPPYYTKPSSKAQKVQEQLEKYPDATVLDIEAALNEAAQQSLIVESHKLISVNAPEWLRIKQRAPKVFSPKPKFYKLD